MEIRKVILVAFIVIIIVGSTVIIIPSMPQAPPTNGETHDTTPPVITIT